MHDLVPLMIFAIPIMGIIHSMVTKLAKTRLEEARLRAGEMVDGGLAAIEDLRAEVDGLRAELSEVHERLDFTERLLAKGTTPAE
ncbi:MAG: hypothetical protein IPP98_10600 [Gemmatimonadetes bacterium]|nr:hypothetical protein [Gemmatimonadota bacterium]MBL0179558.1 hypothetical protein [Gemmatimonadota bacterium]